MKCVYLLVFVLLIQLFSVQAGRKKDSSGSGDSSGSRDSSGSSDSSGSRDSSGSSDSSGSRDSSGSKGSSDSSDSSKSSDSGSHQNKRKSKNVKKETKNSPAKTVAKQCGIETILIGMPKPLDTIAASIKISINNILSSLLNIQSQTGSISILAQRTMSIFDILSKITGVKSLNSSFESLFDRIKLTFSSCESGLGRSVVDTAKQATADIQITLSKLLTLISTKSSSLNVSSINNLIRQTAENIQILISVIQATITVVASETTRTFDNALFEAIISLQILTTPILYVVQWVLSLTAVTSLSVNGRINSELSSVNLAVATILQNISKIMITISNAGSSGFSQTVNLIASPVTKLSSSVNTSLSPISGTVINVTITREQVTSNTQTTVYNY